MMLDTNVEQDEMTCCVQEWRDWWWGGVRFFLLLFFLKKTFLIHFSFFFFFSEKIRLDIAGKSDEMPSPIFSKKIYKKKNNFRMCLLQIT